MSFTKDFNLRQHTPLIQFQHEQDGATLRATELKPKLDQFINKTVDKTAVKPFYADTSDEEKTALDYKLRISAEKVEEFIVGSSIPRGTQAKMRDAGERFLTGAPYFADNELIKKGNWDKVRRAVTYRNIKVEVFSYHKQILAWVEEALPKVLAYENFGTRQSKGFGCFSLQNTSQEEFEGYLEEHPDYGEEILCKQLDRNRSSYEHIFKAIDGEYKILKSGFAKEDSQLMLYFDEEKNIEWEKPSIKRKLVGRGSGGKSDLTTNEKVKYVRALLGVAELYEFPQRRSKVHIECYDKEGNPPKTAIERFRSPLTFKVFDDTIYILTNPIPDEIYDKTFRFYNDNGQVLINTPPKSADFDLKDFLENHTHESWNYVSE